MDLNLVVLCGTLSAHPRIEGMPSGRNKVELKVETNNEKHQTARYTHVRWMCSDDELKSLMLFRGDRVWISGYIAATAVVAEYVQKAGMDDEEG